jgi:hypothetical protein
MINELTEEQVAMMPSYVEKYKAIGLNTDRIDFEKAVEVLREFLGESIENRKFKYVQSPKGLMTKTKSVTYGNMEAAWVSFYKYFYDNFGICEEIEKMIPIVENCSWVLADDDTIYVVDRPSLIKFDDQERAHCENGPAIQYPDGFSVYIWHGQRVPQSWIENPEELTEKEFLHHENAEMRRAACEIVGWAKVLEKLNAVVINEDDDPEIGTLLEVDIPDIGKERFLKVLCGTKREFAMPVPPDMTTAIQAQAWMLGFDSVDEFMPPEIRT